MVVGVNAYEEWVAQHPILIQELENWAHTAVYFLPGRYQEAELRSEAACSLLNLLSLYHMRILEKRRCRSTPRLKPWVSSLHTTVRVMQNVEVLIEMLGRHFGGGTGRWWTCTLVEVAKALVRVALVWANGGRMLGTHEEEGSAPNSAVGSPLRVVPRRSHLTLKGHWRTRQQDGRGVVPPQRFPPREIRRSMTPTQVIGDLLFIFRPVLYLAAMRIANRASWRPWAVSLVCDIMAAALSRSAALSQEEEGELLYRTTLLGFYALRSPFYERYTRILVIPLCNALGKVPLLGLLMGNALDLVETLQSHYFYTSAS